MKSSVKTSNANLKMQKGHLETRDNCYIYEITGFYELAMDIFNGRTIF